MTHAIEMILGDYERFAKNAVDIASKYDAVEAARNAEALAREAIAELADLKNKIRRLEEQGVKIEPKAEPTADDECQCHVLRETCSRCNEMYRSEV